MPCNKLGQRTLESRAPFAIASVGRDSSARCPRRYMALLSLQHRGVV